MTIGYGHKIQKGDRFSSPTLNDQQATYLLKYDSNIAADAIRDLVRTKLNQNQFDGLVSLIFNVGRGSFSGSEMLKDLNS